jgi:hypothetical protein
MNSALHSILSGGAIILAATLHAGPWQPLFNGRDLTGWSQVNGTAAFTVVGDSIVGTTVNGSPNSFLATERDFGDFILELETRFEGTPTTSGVMVRGLSSPDYKNGLVHGYQCEIDDKLARGWTGGIYDEARRGWLYPVDLNPAAKGAFQPDRWNLIRIEAIGVSIRTWVNGIAVAHVVDDVTREGFIALQVHAAGADGVGRRVLFRNLRVQTNDLCPAPVEPIFVRSTLVNRLSTPEQSAGWRLLWDGRSYAGWRGAHRSDFPDKGWRIDAGSLIVNESGGGEAKHGGDIVSLEEFSAFELQLEFKLTPGANSGLKYYVTEEHNPGGGSAIGLEFQLLDDEKHPDAKLGAAGNRTLGSLYDLIPRGPMPGGLNIVPKVGAWQHARIVAHADGRVEHWLNGVKVVDYQRGSPLFTALVARSKYVEFPGFGLAPKGRLLLQDHGNEVHFRSIKVRSLD